MIFNHVKSPDLYIRTPIPIQIHFTQEGLIEPNGMSILLIQPNHAF